MSELARLQNSSGRRRRKIERNETLISFLTPHNECVLHAVVSQKVTLDFLLSLVNGNCVLQVTYCNHDLPQLTQTHTNLDDALKSQLFLCIPIIAPIHLMMLGIYRAHPYRT